MKRIVTVLLIAVTSVFALAGPTSAASAKTKPSCLRALNEAEAVVRLQIQFVEAVRTYLNEVGTSAARNSTLGQTGVLQFINDMTAAVNTLSGTTQSLTGQLTPHATAYSRAAAKCRR